MTYLQLVTIQEGNKFFMSRFMSKKPMPTREEWNEYIVQKAMADREGWVLINMTTFKV